MSSLRKLAEQKLAEQELAKQKLAEQEVEEKTEKKDQEIKKKSKELEIIHEINKSIELNSLKTLYANRFGTTTNMKKVDMQKALMKIWNKENKEAK